MAPHTHISLLKLPLGNKLYDRQLLVHISFNSFSPCTLALTSPIYQWQYIYIKTLQAKCKEMRVGRLDKLRFVTQT